MAEETVRRESGESRPEEVIREKEERRSGEVRREEVREEREGGRPRRVRRVEVVEERRRRAQRDELTIVDMGKKSRKAVRDLRRGKGRLMDDIEDTIDELREAGAISESAHPLVVIVERRASESGGMFSVFLPPGIPGMLPMGMRRDDDDDEDDEDEDDEDD